MLQSLLGQGASERPGAGAADQRDDGRGRRPAAPRGGVGTCGAAAAGASPASVGARAAGGRHERARALGRDRLAAGADDDLRISAADPERPGKAGRARGA
ncbi:MAG: hypothetical protein KIT58_09220 [Planctomycetota bacterium]|nr:hypothetical protein [Planctomycetota bacterium]